MAHQAYHLLVDIWNVPPERAYLLRFPAPILALMETIRRSVDMGILGKPFVVYAEDEGKAWGPGVTALIPLVDSHVSLHCLEVEQTVHFDLFSCKQFDADLVCRILQDAFGGQLRRLIIDRSDYA